MIGSLGSFEPVSLAITPEQRTQDGRPLRRYRRRWKVERLFAWFQNFRRIVVRYARHWAVSADGGQPRLLVTFDDPSRRSLRREFATDGRRFYFTIAEDESDLSALELIAK